MQAEQGSVREDAASRHTRNSSNHSSRSLHSSSRHAKSDSRHTRQSSRHMSSLAEENIELTEPENTGQGRPSTSKRSMHWPFKSSISSRDMLNDAASSIHQMEPQPAPFRDHASILRRYASTRQTLNHQRSRSSNMLRQHHPRQLSTSTMRTVASSSTLFPVPDYVANYIRGDTPEMVAERREERSKRGQQRFAKMREGMGDLAEGQEGEFYGPRGSRHRLPSWVLEKNIAMEGAPGQEHPRLEARRGSAERVKGWLPAGWRLTVSMTLMLVGLLIAAFITMLALAAVKYKDKFWAAESTLISESTCRTIEAVNRGTHAAAAAVGILLLAGASHAAQVIGAPTRKDLDETHAIGGVLNIAGGFSLRNMRAVSWGRTLLSAVLVLVSTAMLLAFNALTFTTAKSEITADFSELGSTTCSLTVNGTLLGAVLILLVITAGILVVTLIRPTFNPLVTLGDAISSLMSRPDVSIRQSSQSIVSNGQPEWDGRGTPAQQALMSDGGNEMVIIRWMGTVTLGKWLAWLAAFLVPFALTIVALAICLAKDAKIPAFGVPTWMHESSITSSGIGLAILVSSPQILVAFLYLTTSSLLTSFFSARELEGYEAAARAAATDNGVVRLRVSQREEGMQTTSWYITLPPFVSWMLCLIFGGMSFLVNQSLLLTVFNESDGKPTPTISLVPLPLVILSGLLGALAAGIACMSLFCRTAVPRKLKGSQAIAAWCRFWSASPEEVREQNRQTSAGASSGEQPQQAGDRRSWSGQSIGQGTIASGMWMAAGR